MTGGFAQGPMRTGASQGTNTEVILKSLNAARGSAYDPQPGTILYAENMAIARVLADVWETAQRFANQFDPTKLTVYLSRWEKILGISPLPDQTDTERRAIIAAKFAVFGKVPLHQIVKDYVAAIEPDVFLDVLNCSSSEASGYVPGGATITGGVTLPDGDWSSGIAHIAIRLYQPTTMDDGIFYDQANRFADFLDKFLPVWITFDWGRYTYDGYGTISMVVGSTTVTGSGTYFLTDGSDPIAAGDEIEVYNDDGDITTLVVVNVASDTVLTVRDVATVAITAKPFKTKGFILDHELNIDNSLFD